MPEKEKEKESYYGSHSFKASVIKRERSENSVITNRWDT
jgi:hypothetical protein